jgi:hypothetical protein
MYIQFSYGTIFWGSSTYSSLIFKTQTRIVRIIMKARHKESCHPLFRQLNILPLHSQYIFSLLLFMVKNLEIFSFNSDVHSINIRQVSNLHFPANKAKVQKGVYYSWIRIFNNLPQSARNLSSYVINFRQALKKVSSFWLILFPKWILWAEHEGWSRFLYVVSSTSGGRSVGIVRSRTKGHGGVCKLNLNSPINWACINGYP